MCEAWIDIATAMTQRLIVEDLERQTRCADIERLIVRLAGIVGVDPGPVTLRQGAQMYGLNST